MVCDGAVLHLSVSSEYGEVYEDGLRILRIFFGVTMMIGRFRVVIDFLKAKPKKENLHQISPDELVELLIMDHYSMTLRGLN